MQTVSAKMLDMKISPARFVKGVIDLPGDKSISHRAAILAAMASGRTQIENFATGADCGSTLGCLRQLGVRMTQNETTVVIEGVGKDGFTEPVDSLDCGNSGTTMRLLAGVLAGQRFRSTLTGDASLARRPMHRIIEPIDMMGSKVDSDDDRPPLTIAGVHPLEAIEYEPSIASAQVKSCVLLAGLNGDGVTTVLEQVETRDHTERLLGWFGADVKVEKLAGNGRRISVSGDSRLTARDVVVPADVSSAAFFAAAAVCLKGSEITLPTVGVNPTRTAFLEVLSDLGADIESVDRREQCGEPVATLHIKGGLAPATDKMTVIDGSIIPALIDEIPVLAVVGTHLATGLEIRDASELRAKESDRIAAMTENLRRMGARVTEYEDGFRVERADLHGASVDAFGDHRIAMALAVAALLAREGGTEIAGAECVDISFPGFFDLLQGVVRYQ